jgi:hypothetical protein
MPPVSAHRRRLVVHALLAACGGFLLATLWFDLMFDLQVVGRGTPLPETTIASIAAYYRRVTTDAHPMQRLIAMVMLVTLCGSVGILVERSFRGLKWVALLAAATPIGLAAARVFPDAIRLGARAGSLDEQSALARSIFVSHVFCLVSIAVFTAIQIVLVTLPQPPPPNGDRR